MKGCVENLKLQFDYNSFYLYLLYLFLLWLGILMLNWCSEKYHGIKPILNGNNPQVLKLCKFTLRKMHCSFRQMYMLYKMYMLRSIADHEQIRKMRKSTIVPNMLLELVNILIEMSRKATHFEQLSSKN